MDTTNRDKPRDGGEDRKLGIALVLAGGICWGFIGIFVQAIGPVIDTFTLSILRLGIASILMVPVIILQKGVKAFLLPAKNLYFFILFGLGYWPLYQLSYFSAIQMVSANIAVILLYTAPFYVIVLARIFLGETITKRKVIAAVLGVAGVWIMFMSWAMDSTPAMLLGGLLGLGAGFFFATYYIYVKKALVASDPFITSFYSMFFGCIFIMLATLIFFRDRVYYQLDARSMMLIVGIAFVSTVLGNTLSIMGMKRLEAGEAGVLGLIEPITTLIASWLIFGSVLRGWQFAGALLVLSGAYLIYRQPGLGTADTPENYERQYDRKEDGN
jgi:drug/metabolite transporter (DMT)-like permease